MAEVIGIVGPSGSGKSRSIKTLDPKETIIIAVDSKGLPFPGWKRDYTPLTAKDFDKGNYIHVDSSATICKILHRIADERPEIKNIVIDDFQYIMGNEFMLKWNEKGYEKFSSIGYNGWIPIKTAKDIKKDDLMIFFLFHDEDSTDSSYNPRKKIKTIGKMVDEKYTLEGMFRILFFTKMSHDPKTNVNTYGFTTQGDGINTAKSPEGMFKDYLIENDLQFVRNRIEDYDHGYVAP